MNKFIEIFNSLVLTSFKQIIELLTQFGPRILLAGTVIVLGWIFAVVIRKIVSTLLKALGFDVLAEKFGLKKILERGDIKRNSSAIIGRIFFWFIILNSFVMAGDILSISKTTQLLQMLIIYLPRIAVLTIIISLGIITGKFIDKLTYRASLLANIPFSTLIGKLAGYIIIGTTLLLGINYLGVHDLVNLQFSILIITIIPVFILLTLIIGGKKIISNIISYRIIIQEYHVGDIIQADKISGKIDTIDIFAVKLKKDNFEIVIPNSKFAELIIKKTM